MSLKRNGPARGEAGVQLGGEPGSLSKNGSEKQSVSDAPIHLIGSPKVSIANGGTSSLVTVANAPWGWGDLDRCFLHLPLKTKSASAEKYALQLRQKIAAAAWKEHERRERIKEAKRREREAGQ